MFKAKLFSLLFALLIIQNASAKPLDDSKTVTATPQELTEMDNFIEESSITIAKKFRQMFKDEIIGNGAYPELKWFQDNLYYINLINDDIKTIDDHRDLVEYFLDMIKQTMNLTAANITPGSKALEDLFEKYECRQLAMNIEIKLKEWKSEEGRKKN